MQILWQKKQTIDLGRVGHLSGLHPALTSLDLRTLHDTMAAFAVAQAMLQGIGGGQTESALSIRQIIPSLDFVDATDSGTAPLIAWRQPVGNANYTITTNTEADVQTIYNTSKNCKNDQKIMIIYGLRAIGVGNSHPGTIVRSNEWQFWRTGTKLIDRWYVQQLNCAPECFVCGITPIMYKKDDLATIKVISDGTAADANKFDQLQVLGVICEALGTNSMG